MVSPWFCTVHPARGTPINATISMLIATAIIAFFTELPILANLLSISTLFVFMLVALALLVRRYYATGETSPADKNKLIASLVLIMASSAGNAIYWVLGGNKGWIGYVVMVPIWFASTFYLWMFVPPAKTPKLWGVPLVPWIPSASIAINIFLLGSIDGRSFARFGIWTVIILVYYFLFGLHASYDTAKASQAAASRASATMLEEGSAATPAPAAAATSTTYNTTDQLVVF